LNNLAGRSTVLSDVQIMELISQNKLKIEPFDDSCLKSASYDLRVGEYAYSWSKRRRVDIRKKEKIRIEPGDLVLVRTLEKVELPNGISGTVHSMVALSTLALAPVSTTVDPTWRGYMLIPIQNVGRTPIYLYYSEPFCTIILYETGVSQRIYDARERQDFEIWIKKIIDESERRRPKYYFKRRPILLTVLLSILISTIVVYIIYKPSQDFLLLFSSILLVASMYIIEILKE